MNYDRWWIALLFGAFTVVLGVILVRNPFKVVNTVVRVIGAFLVYRRFIRRMDYFKDL